MQIKELIEELTKLPGDLTVMIASDEEGNSFRDLWEVSVSKWSGEDPLHPDDADEFEAETGETLEQIVIMW